jgi:hypothetical protein
MPVTLNLRTCCLALDLDVAMVQIAAPQLARQQTSANRSGQHVHLFQVM